VKQAFLVPMYDNMYNDVFTKGQIIHVVGVITCKKGEVRDEPLYLCEKHNPKNTSRSYLHVVGDEVWESFCNRTIESYIEGIDASDYEEPEPYTKTYTWVLACEIEFVEGNTNAKHVLEKLED